MNEPEEKVDKLHNYKLAGKEVGPPPNYRMTLPGEVAKCKSCRFYIHNKSLCKKFDVKVDPNALCDAYSPTKLNLGAITPPGMGAAVIESDVAKKVAFAIPEVKPTNMPVQQPATSVLPISNKPPQSQPSSVLVMKPTSSLIPRPGAGKLNLASKGVEQPPAKPDLTNQNTKPISLGPNT
jgi:hypothetical protein